MRPVARHWQKLGAAFLPFADAASPTLPLPRLLRLCLFQVSAGIAVTLLIGTLNRVMIVELAVPAWLVAVMVALPLVFAPFRALIGFRSDTHRSVLGWRRIPYLWMGTLLQFGGLAIMPFALIVLSGDSHAPAFVGQAGAALAFLLLGAGLHTAQTAGLALATDLAPRESVPKVVALLCVAMLAGVVLSALLFGLALRHFSEVRLIQVIQASALLTFLLNGIAMWKQEPRDRARRPERRQSFAEAWRAVGGGRDGVRRLVAIGLGTIGFSMQDVLLEPYGGQILHLPVGATTALTALLGVGGLAGFIFAANRLARDTDPYRLAAAGVGFGMLAFAALIFSAPLAAPRLFAAGVALIGFGGGLFAAGTLTAVISMTRPDRAGLALGAWGAVQATAAGGAIAAGGLLRDAITTLGASGRLGPALASPAAGYGVVYHLEIFLLLATLIALGPLARPVAFRLPAPARLP